MVAFSFVTKPLYHTYSEATLYTDQTWLSRISIFELGSSFIHLSAGLQKPDFGENQNKGICVQPLVPNPFSVISNQTGKMTKVER